MYTALAKHAGICLTMTCKGDLWIDDHHTADMIIFELIILQYLIFQPHRTVRSPWAPLSNRLLAKYAVLDDTELVSPLSMKSVVCSPPHKLSLASCSGTVSSCHRYLLSAILCIRSRPSEGKNRRPLDRDDSAHFLFICNRVWGYITCRRLAWGKRSPSVWKNCHYLTIIPESLWSGRNRRSKHWHLPFGKQFKERAETMYLVPRECFKCICTFSGYFPCILGDLLSTYSWSTLNLNRAHRTQVYIYIDHSL